MLNLVLYKDEPYIVNIQLATICHLYDEVLRQRKKFCRQIQQKGSRVANGYKALCPGSGNLGFKFSVLKSH